MYFLAKTVVWLGTTACDKRDAANALLKHTGAERSYCATHNAYEHFVRLTNVAAVRAPIRQFCLESISIFIKALFIRG